MTANADIVDRYIEQRTWLLRYENRVVRDVLEVMARGEEQAIGAIASAYDELLSSDRNLVAWDGRGIQTRRKALRRVRAALADVFPEARQSLRGALEGVSTYAQDEFVDALEENLPKPALDELELSSVPERQLANILDDKFGERLEGSAAAFKDGLKELEDSTVQAVDRMIVDGIRDGDGTRAMMARARKLLGPDASSKLSRDVATYVRTSVQTTANDVAGQVYQENSDILKGETYIATLDDDTCPICGPLDGTFHPFDERGRSTIPRPPRHPNCRCFASPVVKSWQEMGLPDTLPAQAKKNLDGKPAKKTTWTDWVQRNPKRLERAVGPTRAKLVQSGEMSLKDFVNKARTEVRTLDKLEEMRKRRAA